MTSKQSSSTDKDVKKEPGKSSTEQRIRQIEVGIEPEFYDVINDRYSASRTLVELANSVTSEALILLPNDKSMLRLDRLKVFDYVIKASQENAAEVKIICPLSKVNFDIVKRISDDAPHIKVLNGNNLPYGMFIVDGHKFFRAELRDPNADELSEAIGFTIYSNSRRSVDSFKSIFDLLWSERLLNEELKRADKMQKDFINIAAHELRTPAQSILGYAELASSDPELRKHDKQGILDAMYRNAFRLQRLTNGILDVTRIESHSLELNKELFNLNKLISNIVLDIKRQNICGLKGKVSLTYKTDQDKKDDDDNNNNNSDYDAVFVEADKERIGQVLYNLLENAVKFGEANNTVWVTLEQKKQGEDVDNKRKDHQHQQEEKIAIVKIEDRGNGIHPDIFPRLFTKFATKSLTGTGLGLYICKCIVEAHDGKIWAKNNSNEGGGRGATFAFSLPLAK